MKVKGKRLESTKLGVSGRSYPWIYPGILRQSFPPIEGIFFLNLSYWISYWMNFWIILRYLQFIPFLKAQFLELWVLFFFKRALRKLQSSNFIVTELWKPIVDFLNALLKSEQNGAIWAPLGLSLLPYLPPHFANKPYFRDFLWYFKCQEEWGAGKGGWSGCECSFFTGQFERTTVIRQENFIVFLLDTQPKG